MSHNLFLFMFLRSSIFYVLYIWNILYYFFNVYIIVIVGVYFF